MFYDRQFHTFIEEKVIPQQKAVRLADGSIDYAYYKERARRYRSESLMNALSKIRKHYTK